ncbi:tape measure protein [Apilactobacillus xinyiensis]|uniref:aggregation-promoting factor C-terminal-like domain-containing protein n=1 Tax=Apilactobacillus xinyiensis TaxID=2841032 RepID=UPI002010B2C6|nr:tape measure protein [Apilactobacillus xinyiensis]MCL0330532.1 tape measure protein [Apilactobacillus xinyiensis]
MGMMKQSTIGINWSLDTNNFSKAQRMTDALKSRFESMDSPLRQSNDRFSSINNNISEAQKRYNRVRDSALELNGVNGKISRSMGEIKDRSGGVTAGFKAMNDAMDKVNTSYKTSLEYADKFNEKTKTSVTKVQQLRQSLIDLDHINPKITPEVNVDHAKRAMEKVPKMHVFGGVAAGTMVGNALANTFGQITEKTKEALAAGMQYDQEQQKMNATWTTLTNSASKARGMVDTVNELSVKTGQATDTVDELEQGFYHLHSNKGESDAMTKSMLNMADAVGLTVPKIQAVTQDMVNGLSRGKANGGMLNQISQYFPMFREQLAEYETSLHHGKKVTTADLSEMAKKGQISASDIEKVFTELGNHKYDKAADNMLQTMVGMQRTIHARVPALIGAFEEPIMQAKNPFYGAMSKWVSDKNTQKEFNTMGQATSKGINTITSAFAKAYGLKNGTRTLDNATTVIAHGITNMSNAIARNAPQIKNFFTMTKDTGVLSFKLFAAVMSDVAKITLPFLNFIVKHEQTLVPVLAGLFVTKKALGFAGALRSVASSIGLVTAAEQANSKESLLGGVLQNNSFAGKFSKGSSSVNRATGAFTTAKGLGSNLQGAKLGSLAAKEGNGAFRSASEISAAGRYSRFAKLSSLSSKIGSSKLLTGAKTVGSKIPYLDVLAASTQLIGMNHKNAGGKIGSAGGMLAGTMGGAAIGSVIPGLGTGVGALIGSVVGGMGGSSIGKKIGEGIQKSFKAKDGFQPHVRQTHSYFDKPAKGMQDNLSKANANFNIYKNLGNSKFDKSQKSRIINENRQLYTSLESQVDKYSKFNQSKSQQDAKILSKYSGKTRSEILAHDNAFYKNSIKNANSAIGQLIKAEANGGKGRQQAVDKANRAIAKSMSNGADQQKIILGKLGMTTKKMSDKQASEVIKQSFKSYKDTKSNANKMYNSAKTAAEKKYKKVVAAADRERFVTGSINDDQYKKIIGKAKDQKKKVISDAETQRDKSIEAAQTQHDKIVSLSKSQTKDHLKNVDEETGGIISAVDKQASAWDKARRAEESYHLGHDKGLKYAKKSDKNTSFWQKIGKVWYNAQVSGNRNAYKAKTDEEAGKKHGMPVKPTWATGGKITKNHSALVNEFGPESAWNPQKGTFRFLGNGNPTLARLFAGEHVLNAQQTKQIVHGNMNGNFKSYAKGTGFKGFSGSSINSTIHVKYDNHGIRSSLLTTKKYTKQITNYISKAYKSINTNSNKELKLMSNGSSKIWKQINKQTTNQLKTMDKESDKISNSLTKSIVSGAKDLDKQLSPIWKDITSDFKSAFAKLSPYAHSGMNSAVNQLNGGIKGIDSALSQFGGNSSVLKPIHYAQGTGAVTHDHIAMVNDAKSGPTREAIVNQHGHVRYANGRNALTKIRKGESVLNGHDTLTAINKGYIPHYASGKGSHDALRKLAEQNSKQPSAAWASEFANKVHANGSTLQKGVTNSASNGAKSVGIPWEKSMWGLINGLASGGSGSKSAFLNYAMQKFTGKPYVLGADGPTAFDCSGMVSKALEHFGINIGRTTTAMQSSSGLERIGRNIHKTQAGDIALFGHGTGAAGHVGIVNNPRSGTIFNETPPRARTTPLSYITALPLDAFYRVKGLHNADTKKGGNSKLDALVKRQLGKRAMNWVSNNLAPAIDGAGGTGPAPTGDHSHWLQQAGIPKSWWPATNEIITKESGWNPKAQNPSGAYGLPQSLPGSKMASAGSDWRTNPITQLKWYKHYINSRYGGIGQALSFRHAHGWYAKGGRPPLHKPVVVGENGPEIAEFDSPVKIHSNNESKQMASKLGKKGSVNFNPTINITVNGGDNNTAKETARIVKQELYKLFTSQEVQLSFNG